MAATVLSSGTPSSGKPSRNIGVISAAPLIPLNVAVAAMTMHAGSMNQYTVQSMGLYLRDGQKAYTPWPVNGAAVGLARAAISRCLTLPRWQG